MSAEAVAALSAQIEGLTTLVSEHDERHHADHGELKRELGTIQDLQRETNGRVKELEVERAAREAAEKVRQEARLVRSERRVRKEDYRKVGLPSILIAAAGTLIGLAGVLVAAL